VRGTKALKYHSGAYVSFLPNVRLQRPPTSHTAHDPRELAPDPTALKGRRAAEVASELGAHIAQVALRFSLGYGDAIFAVFTGGAPGVPLEMPAAYLYIMPGPPGLAST